MLATSEHAPAWGQLGRTARTLLAPGCQVGVHTAALISGPRTAAGHPALSLWAAWGLEVLGAVTLHPQSPPSPHPTPSDADFDHGDFDQADFDQRDDIERAGVDGDVDREAPALGGQRERLPEGSGTGGHERDGPWERAGGSRLDELIRRCHRDPALLVLADAGPGVEGLVVELGRRHPGVPMAGALIPAIPPTHRRPSPTGTPSGATARLQLDGQSMDQQVVVVVLGQDRTSLGTHQGAGGCMEVTTSQDGWPPPEQHPRGSGGPFDPVSGVGVESPAVEHPDPVGGDLVLDVLQRGARAALVFERGWGGALAADLDELQLPVAGLSGVMAIGPVMSPGFARGYARPGQPAAPAMPVAPAIAVALFRDRSDPT